MKPVCSLLGSLLVLSSFCHAESLPQASFFRGVNLAGPAIQMDGYDWQAGDDDNVRVQGSSFENQEVALVPRTDVVRAQMIRSSRWGGNLDIQLLNVPSGWYQVFIYAWEDNHTTDFQLQVNDRQVIERFSSGSAGRWHRLGPFPAQVKSGEIKVSARGGDANLSGIEVWSGRGPLPTLVPNGFVSVPTSEQIAFFERRIRPLLVEHCYQCHSAEASELGGGLLLDSRRGLLAGGDTERPVIPTDTEHSLLVRAVSYADAHLKMPPDEKLADDEIAALKSWIAMGVPDPRDEDTIATYKQRHEIDWDAARDFWSLRPINRPRPPNTKHAWWLRNDIDGFVVAKIEANGLEPASDADKRRLIRRATFDLIGLPPRREEIDEFVNDDSPDAFAHVIDRLLSSRHYGERWGRHWLDVVRYSDTAGDNSDFPIPQMASYRDWVINAFNRDLPYDEFVRQQLAGDLLHFKARSETYQPTIATGYIANARRFGSRVDDYPQHLTIEDTIDNVGRTFLASTINCARCHDHKFDPFTTADYYGIYGIFNSTRYPWPGIELDQQQRDLIALVSEAEYQAALDAKAASQKPLDELVKQLEAEVKVAQEGSAERKELDNRLKDAKDKAEKNAKTPLPIDDAYAVSDAKSIDDAAIQIKGDPAKLGDLVPRHFLTVLGGQTLLVDDTTSGRLQLANWILDEQNPLTMRAIVNRVWLYHFGKGIVPTPNDFGRQGKPPTHPELLDWLATEFRNSGYSIKALHRTIMLSHTYQMSSQVSELAADHDPNNEWLSAFPQRRLDAEAIRDTVLMLGGTLDLSPAGPHPFPPPSDWKFTQHNPFKAVYESNHRSVYLMTQRIQRHPFLAIFDGPDPSVSTPQRSTSTTPLQSLYFLNDPVVHEQANQFADTIVRAGDNDATRLSFAYLQALGREPSEDEISATVDFLARSKAASGKQADEAIQYAWQAMVRVIFRLNEFVYVD